MANFPDGIFKYGLLIFGNSLSKDTAVSKGVWLEVPDIRSSSIKARNQQHEDIRVLLSLLGDEYAVQVQWFVDSDYHEILESYREKTLQLAKNDWERFSREERYFRYREAMEQGELRRERLAIFISKKVSTVPCKDKTSITGIDNILREQIKIFNKKIETIFSVFPTVRSTPMDNEEHYYYYLRYLNPSLLDIIIEKERRYTGFNPDNSILENCLSSDLISVRSNNEVFFKLDGKYHAQFVITRTPKESYPGAINLLTDCLNKDFCISQNIYRLDPDKEIDEEEKLIRRLISEITHEGRISQEEVVHKKREKIRALMRGLIVPFKALTIVRTWANSIDELSKRTLAVKTAMQAMSGLKYFQINQEAQASNLFHESFPGWLGGNYRGWDIYVPSDMLATIMPFSGTFIGHIDSGESLYDGQNGNLVGMETFAGTTPKHSILLGRTRAGKSVNMIDYLSQTACFYDFDFLVEEGLSYSTYTKLLGEEPIIIKPDSNLTLNYFDTNGLPLNSENISVGSALCAKLFGSSRDEDKNNKRVSIIREYIAQLYNDRFNDWRKESEERYEQLCRLALACETYRIQSMGNNDSFVDAYLAIRELKENNDSRYQELINAPSDKEVTNFSINARSHTLIKNLSFAFFTPEEFPTHTALVELMKYGKLPHHKGTRLEDDVTEIATILSASCRDGGINGVLIDGTTNFRIDGRVAHFELGYIPDSSKQLKEVAGFLISNNVRQHIMKLPRSRKKRAIVEEVSRFLDVPGGDKLLAEFYAQMGKYSCAVTCVSQQYAQLKNSPLKAVIFGNSKTFMLMSQLDHDDLSDIADLISLPDTAQEAIMGYTLPENQRGRKCGYLTYFNPAAEYTECGTVRNFTSPEMLYVASSEGDAFDARQKALRKYKNVFEGVMTESELLVKNKSTI